VQVEHLRAEPTSFIGREDELAQITRCLLDPTCRLLTLVGAGGIGKTRLAAQVATQILDEFMHGAYFVPLAPLKSSDDLISTIANAMHFPFHSNGDPRQQLLDFLREKYLLLVLDNFEHLLAGATLVRDMLEAAPTVKFLITSREPLNLQQEWVRHIDGLTFPDGEQAKHPERYSAVQLFTQSALHVQAGFSLEKDQRNVIRICRLVQGVPLAIELAAAWLKTLSIEDVVIEIQRNLDFLSTPLRDVPERHRSIRAVFTWSWQLLSEPERFVFRRLAVFRGGFRREAAEAIAGATLPMLSVLVGKSLVKRSESGRYEIHELLRQYGEEQVIDTTETEAVQNAHCLFFSEFLRQREADLKGRRQLAALGEIEADFENIRASWTWAASHRMSGALTASIGSLLLFCEMRSRFQEGRQFFDFAGKQLSDTSDPASSTVLHKLIARKVRIEVLGYLTHHDESRTKIETCLEAASGRGDADETAFCLSTLGVIMAVASENKMGAVPRLEASLAYYRRVGDKYHQGRILQRLGLCHFESRFDLFARYVQEGYDTSREAGDRIGMANCLYNLGTVNGLSGNYFAEEHYYSEALAIRRETGDLANISVNAAGLCHTVLIIGDLERASALAHEALEIADRINHADGRNFALMELGFLAILREDYWHGQRLCEESHAITTRIDINPLRTALVDSYLALAACGLGDYETARQHFQSSLQFGAKTGLLEVIKWALPTAAILKAQDGFLEESIELLALALHPPSNMRGWVDKSPLIAGLITRLEQQVGADVFEVVWRRGSGKALADVIAVLERFQLLPAEADVLVHGRPRANRNSNVGLTDRELEMIQLIAAGLTNQEIAQRLFIGVSTVKKHINHIFSKLGATSRTQAIVRAKELNLL
jgi:predicted ATPase/DNA-binding CsgD family transcriptional regulator